MSDVSSVMFAAIKPKYFEPFYNFQSLLLNTCTEGSLRTKSDAIQAAKALEKKLLGNREVCDLSKTDDCSPELDVALKGLSCTEHKDGLTISVLPPFSGADNCCVCVKSNRTSVICFAARGAFSIDLCSQALIYGDEKYSLGVMSADGKSGFAIRAGAGDSGIKGEVQLKSECFTADKYIIDKADKYIDVAPYIKYVKG